MGAYDDLEGRLQSATSAPFLFVGAGVSKRYLGTDSWVDLLKRMAAKTPHPYAYYVTKASGKLDQVATEIAAVFHAIWWSEDEYTWNREAFGDDLTSLDGPLKVEVAVYTESTLANIARDGLYGRELDLLRQAIVDGVITTNYDGLMEVVFPDFKTFVGEDELLFSDAQGVGEIYKIHGSASRPESLVLTADDYRLFNERNPYLAAKLLTIFVEHPVVFLGYSLTDPDVTSLLVSVASVLTTENLGRLQERLIFVDWDPNVSEATLGATQIAVRGFSIPVILLKVPDFEALFGVLGRVRRKFPARLLRRLKEQLYELVLSKEPDERLAVVDIEDATAAANIEVVFGVGVHRHLGRRGYVGLSREDLLVDVLRPAPEYVARDVVDEVLPRVLKTTTYVPIFRYLRGAGLLRDDGTLLRDAEVDGRVATRVSEEAKPLAVHQASKSRAQRLVRDAGDDFEQLAATQPLADVLLAVLALNRSTMTLEAVRAYLLEHADAFHNSKLSTAWAKAVCLYDYLRFGLADAASPRRKGRPTND